MRRRHSVIGIAIDDCAAEPTPPLAWLNRATNPLETYS
jgi:hypothetical protein